MGLITQTITFTQGLIPTAAQWQSQFDSAYNLVNGQLDSANVDKTSADGIMVLDTAQTRTGTLTHNADIIVGNTYGIIIGDATQVAAGGVTSELQVVGTAGADASGFVGRWSADASGPVWNLGKSRNATIGSFTIVADNDVLGTLQFLGDDGTDLATPGASIFARVNGTPGANDLPAELVFAITKDAGSAVTEAFQITVSGFIFNEGGEDWDFRVESDTNANAITLDSGLFSGVGAIGLAAAAVNTSVVLIDPPALTAVAATNIARLRLGNTAAITVPAGTTSIAAAVSIEEPNLTATGTITSAVTLYIAAAPTEGGTNNYAIWVDAGVSAFGGNLVPDANDGAALGTTTLGFSDLHLATGGVINWANGEVTVTETDGNTLTIAGIATRLDLAAGILELNNAVEWDTGIAVVAGEYSVGRDADGTNQLHFNVPTGATFEWSTNDVSQMVFGAGILYLGDTANAQMTTGLTINQGAADNEAFALKSSDVAHGMTSLAETDTYLLIQKRSAPSGGITFRALDGTANSAMLLSSVAGAADTTKGTGSTGALYLDGALKSGISSGVMSANGNIVVFGNGSAATHILDAEGDSHQDVGTAWTNFDDYDDAAMLTALSVHVSQPNDPIRERFREFLDYNRSTLEKARLVTFNEDGHHFVNMSKLAMLHTGALRQAYQRIESLEQKIKLLSVKN